MAAVGTGGGPQGCYLGGAASTSAGQIVWFRGLIHAGRVLPVSSACQDPPEGTDFRTSM